MQLAATPALESTPSRLRSATFSTRQAADPPHVVRTFGRVVALSAGSRTADVAYLSHAPRKPPPDCARDKLAVVRGGVRPEIACYQAAGGEVQLVACGNATAAAAAMTSGHCGRLRLPRDCQVAIEVDCRDQAGSQAVTQTWRGIPPLNVRHAVTGGRSCAACVSPLNDYLIVQLRAGEALDEFTVVEAQTMWRRFGFERQPALARLAAVERSNAGPARVRFFTCGARQHPSAPLTGLAILALAARQLDWLQVPAAGAVSTPGGMLPLPQLHVAPHGAADIVFPPVVVDLEPDLT